MAPATSVDTSVVLDAAEASVVALRRAEFERLRVARDDRRLPVTWTTSPTGCGSTVPSWPS